MMGPWSGPASVVLLLAVMTAPEVAAQSVPSADQVACEALTDIRNLTITSAKLATTETSLTHYSLARDRQLASGVPYCYVQGLLPPAIRFHLQLPLPLDWNGRFLHRGDGGADGDLDFVDYRVAEGYAVTNSNTGHDNGAEPGWSFGFHNRQAEIDYGYRAVHLTVTAAKTVINAYYGSAPRYSYHEGCSQGGRQGLMEAQRYPGDFDGIVAGAPANFFHELFANRAWMVQRGFRNGFAGNLAFDTDGDGSLDSLHKLDILSDAVLAACDANDRITDGVIDDPPSCAFDVDVAFADLACPGDVNAKECFTTAQLQTIKDLWTGASDSTGRVVLKGMAVGTEPQWAMQYLPHAGNSMFPSRLRVVSDLFNYLFYETDPGVPVADPTDLSYRPDKTRTPPEFAWWEFTVDDLAAGRGDVMRSILNADDPNLTDFLVRRGGKLLLYHGWGDSSIPPEPTQDYYTDVVTTTFSGDLDAARTAARLFMVPGMGHCFGGPGPDRWDRLAPLVAWVEQGQAPDFLVATHETDGVVDNERPVCAYPERAVYTGPAGGANDPANWVASNFTCR